MHTDAEVASGGYAVSMIRCATKPVRPHYSLNGTSRSITTVGCSAANEPTLLLGGIFLVCIGRWGSKKG